MATQFICTCGTQVLVPDHGTRIEIQCPSCGQLVPVPDDAQTPFRGSPDGPATAVYEPVSLVDADTVLPTPKAPPQQPGQFPVIEGYEILDELGRGGMGVVYKAWQVSLNRLVALKMILAGACAGPRELERFRREAESAAGLHHPHIVQIFATGTQDGLAYFSQELMEKGTLAQAITGQPQEPNEAATLVEILARTMQHAHEQGIVHRDLKPGNILLAADGLPKIADFGLAKHLEAKDGQTQSGAVLGTPSYMAPEQVDSRNHTVGPAADVYALGAILYELLTGRPPFKAASAMDTMIQVASDEPVPPSRLQPKVPKDLETISLKCLQKHPAKRYASALALAEDLERFLHSKPIHARPVTKAERLWRWCKRNPALAGTGAVAVATLVAMVVVLSILLQNSVKLAESNEAKLQAEQRARKQAEWDAAHLLFEQAHAKCLQEDMGVGLLWLARALRKAEEVQIPSLEESIRLHLGGWSQHFCGLRFVFQAPVRVLAVAFSADGKTVLTGSEDGTARLWDADTGKPVGPILQHPKRVAAVALSADGTTALTGTEDGVVQLWNVDTGKPLGGPFPHGPVLALSPDGKTVLTAGRDKTARLWRAGSGEPVGEALQHQDAVAAVAFSSDGAKVLTGSWDKTARLWDATTAKALGPALQHQEAVLTVAFSPDGKTLLTGGRDGTARLWEAATGKPLGQPLQHRSWVFAVAFSPDGKTVLSGGLNGTARLWDVGSGAPLRQPLQHERPVMAVAFSSDGKTVLTGSLDATVRLWEAGAGVPHTLQHQESVSAVAFSADGETILTGSWDKTARLWDSATGQAVGEKLHHQDGVEAVAFSPDGKTVLTGSSDGTARLWDALTGRPLGQPLSHGVGVSAVAFSPDGKTVLTGSFGGSARLWDASTGKPLGQAMVHQGAVAAVAFRADGQVLLTGSYDAARLWDATTGKPLEPALLHPFPVTGVAFRPDGKTILTGSTDKFARLWELASGKILGQHRLHSDAIHGVAFSPGGKTVLTGSRDKTALLWEARTGKPLGQPLQHQGWVLAVAFSPDGRSVLTGSADKTARLWQAPAPMISDAERILRWTQIITGMELDEQGVVHVLDADAWKERSRQLVLMDVR